MRTNTHFFSRSERKVALWAMVAAVVLTGGGMALDHAMGPSLGAYDHMGSTQLVGVLEAQPIG
jgi:hypothetical protein